MQANNQSNTIQVERDGVKLGWNILVMLAAIGLGLYVASVIAPIKIKQENIVSRLVTLEIVATSNEQKNGAMRERMILIEQRQRYTPPYQK